MLFKQKRKPEVASFFVGLSEKKILSHFKIITFTINFQYLYL